jgi:uncharacterized protein (DUF885 family)
LGIDGLGFGDFLEESYSLLLVRDPQALTSAGVAELFGMKNDQLNDLSDGYIRETQVIEGVILNVLRTFDREVLTPSEQTSYDVYEWYLDQQTRGHEFMYHEWPVHHFVNSYNFNFLIFLAEEHSVDSLEDAEGYVSRIQQIQRQVTQVIDGLERRVKLGIVPPAIIVEWTTARLANDLGGTPRADVVPITSLPLYTSFEQRLDEVGVFSADVKTDLLNRAHAALAESWVPAWIELYQYMRSIQEMASDDAGVWALPDGDDFYEFLLRGHTSTELTTEEVHELGVLQVVRVETEMRAAFDALGYPASESLPALRQRASDEAGYLDGNATRGVEDILAFQEDLVEEAERVARPVFDLWPQSDVEVVADPGGGGFYVPASFDGSRPGLFHAGTGGKVSLMTVPSVNYHEAVPGHHTQIAIAQELDIPTFRRVIQYNAFVEGWALYAERLASELGLYADDPYGNIGRLELELLRAVRLVVDTGIHAKRWSRAEAHAYMDDIIPTWTHEVERYMVLPGQATGYMIGMQEILRLRDQSEDRVGEEFDVADFHTAVLGSGALPLTILDRVVEDYFSRASG